MTTKPDPDDAQWLLARERGNDVSEIAPERRSRYDQLAKLIEALPEPVPTPGWQQRVFDAIEAGDAGDAVGGVAASGTAPQSPVASSQSAEPTQSSPRTPARRRRRSWAIAGAAIGFAAAIAVALWLAKTTAVDLPDRISIAIQPGPKVRSGDDVRLGDTLVIEVETAHPIELRIYGDADELLARCTASQGCSVVRHGKRTTYTLALTLRAPGAVRTILFTGAAIPATLNNLDADMTAAHTARVDARQIHSARAH